MEDDDGVPAPALLVRDFINTREPQVDEESLTTPADLRGWLVEHHLLSTDVTLGSADLAAAVRIREGLRTVLLENAGHPGEAAALDGLNQTLAELPLRMRFDQQGYRLVGATETPIGQAVGRLADAIRECAEGGFWPRLKVCARDTCRWAFYDASRNQVRRWCSMAGCGNHVKMRRAYAVRKTRAQGLANASPPS